MDASGTEPPAVPSASWRRRLHDVIFETDTPAGRAFDLALLWLIVASVLCVTLESVESVRARHGGLLYGAEWAFTALFTVEYVLRLACVNRPLAYAGSFFGVVDLLSIVPTYLSLGLEGAQSLLIVRSLRLLRMFRVLKLGHFVSEARLLREALSAGMPKISVFLAGVLVTVLISGTVMYMVEGAAGGFTSIPRSVYWAIVTMTTVGYGDIAPRTALGQGLASVLMIVGYGVIAVPTGIVTVELGRLPRSDVPMRACPSCSADTVSADARYCRLCGTLLNA